MDIIPKGEVVIHMIRTQLQEILDRVWMQWKFLVLFFLKRVQMQWKFLVLFFQKHYHHMIMMML